MTLVMPTSGEAHTRENIDFRWDRKDSVNDLFGNRTSHGTIWYNGKKTGFHWEPVETRREYGRGSPSHHDEDIEDLPYVISQVALAGETKKLEETLKTDKFRYLDGKFRGYPKSGNGTAPCKLKRFIQIGTSGNPGPDDGLIMDLIRSSVDW
tara:strand:+ start:2082 stop:2537 length:456 start_codon:yes stop_codon:yes gene_type:complete